MALFGHERDISLFNHLNRELLDRIIEQKVGYYKIDLEATKSNVYGESDEKFYRDPVLITCLIERGDLASSQTPEGTVDVNKQIIVRFFKEHLIDANVVPEMGDIVLYNEDFFEVFNINENQFIVGKDPNYTYNDLNQFGNSLSIIITAKYVRPERFNINEQRL
jgi:hypothetical protein